MWKCPKCGRQFKNINQSHYCGSVNTVDEYISSQPKDVQPILKKIRATIKAAAPNAKEIISYQMPTFWQGKNLISYASFAKHIGIYPGAEATAAFASRTDGLKTTKGAIQLPLDRPIDYSLVSDIAKWRVRSIEQEVRR